MRTKVTDAWVYGGMFVIVLGMLIAFSSTVFMIWSIGVLLGLLGFVMMVFGELLNKISDVWIA